MPALVNIKVGSLRGTSGDEGTTSWPSRLKKPRKFDRISLTPLILSQLSNQTLLCCPEKAQSTAQLQWPDKAYKRSCAMNEQSNAPLPLTLQERLRAGRFVMTAELVPPISCDAHDLVRKAEKLQGCADAVNVTDGAGARAHMSALAAASLVIGMGMEPILQITCRDKNRIALQSEMMGAAALGVRNLLLLTGDDPKAGDQPDTKPVFDIDSKTLIETARRLRDES